MADEYLSSNYLEIDRGALRANARAVCEFVGVPVIGVVKCDGYGMTIPEAAAAWTQAGVDTLAVSAPEEAMALRAAGFTEQDILLLAPVADGEMLDRLLDAGVILTVSGLDIARLYAARGNGRLVRVNVAVDTGMGRFGTRWSDVGELLEIYGVAGIQCTGIFSHCAASFASGDEKTGIQLERFLSAIGALEKAGVNVGIRHLANSCAALRFPETRLDAVRAGSALVGRLGAEVPLELAKVGTLQARVVDRRILKKGETTGYASVCKLRRDTDVAVVAIGKQDGFGLVKRPERLRPLDLLRAIKQALDWCRNPLRVNFAGKAIPVVGRVGTQYTLFDAAGTNIHPGDLVTAEVDLLFPHARRRFVDSDAPDPQEK